MERTRAEAAQATLLVVVSAAAFGAVSTFTVIGTATGASLLSLLFWRYLAGGVLLVAAGGGAGAVWRARGRALRVVLIGGAFQGAIAFTSLSSLRWISAATLGFLFYTYPAWVAVLAMIRGTERVDAPRAIALTLALAGIVLTVGTPNGLAIPLPGLALALGSAIIYAVFMPLIGRLQGDLSPAIASVFVVIGAMTLFAAAGLATGTLSAHLAPRAWGAVAGLALFSTCIGFITLLRGLAILGPVRTAIVSTVEPFWTAVLGAVVLGQPITPRAFAGGALIAMAVIVLQRQGADSDSGSGERRRG
jgi:drug/metabolite transporter (DMT)-like permease